MKVRKRIICIALTLVILISTVPMASRASFALHGTEPEKSGVARLSGTETTYLSLVNSTFRFFKTDNIVLETSDDSFLYRVVVKNVECPEGGSYQWDGTMYTKDDEAGFVISDEDIHKKYGVTYQAQYLDTDDNKWKDLEGVAKYSEIIVRGGTEKNMSVETRLMLRE